MAAVISFFVAEVPEAMCAAVEEQLISDLRNSAIYNIQGKGKTPRNNVKLEHQGEPPVFA